jgi:hypothetical protein
MRPSRNRQEATNPDFEGSFAPEPELRMHGPASILPEAIDEFADEPGAAQATVSQKTAAPVLQRVPLSAFGPSAPPRRPNVPLADQPLLRPPVIAPVSSYGPRTRRSAAQVLLAIFQATAAVACVAAFVWLVVMSNRQGNEVDTVAQEAPAAAESAPPTATKAAPPEVAQPASYQSQPAALAVVRPATLATPSLVPETRAARTSDTRTARTTAPSAKQPESQKQAQLARPTPEPKQPNLAAATKAATPVASNDADRRRTTPTLDVSRLESNTVSALGQPVTPPAAEPPPVLASRERSAVPPPASEPARAVPTTGNAATDARTVERDKVRSVLSRYENAFSRLDAAAAARLYPSVDRKALSRAFGTLSAQQIQFDDCRIQVTQGTARATCAGKASWTPKVGGGPKEEARRWQFDLKQVAGDWQIGSVRVQ